VRPKVVARTRNPRAGRRTAGALLALALSAAAVTMMPVGARAAPEGGTPPAQPEQRNITVGLLPTTGAAGYYLAKRDGYFQRQGFENVDQKLAVTGVTEALIGGEYDFVYSAYVVPFQARDQGLPVKLAAVADEVPPLTNVSPDERRPGVIVLPKSDIRRPKDLEGKSIGVPTASIGKLLLFPAMERKGIDTDKVRLVEVFIPNALQALEQGQVDAVFAPEPYFTEAEKTLDVRMVFDAFAGSKQTFPIAGYFTTDDFAKENPQTVRAFRAAIEEASTTLNNDENAFPSIAPTYLGISEQEARELVPATYGTRIVVADLQREANTMKKLDLLEKKLNVSRMVVREKGSGTQNGGRDGRS
jgi:NitT/TauT family transport system substrate-binding protein